MKHLDTVKTLVGSGAGIAGVAITVDITFKVLIGCATLYYLYLKIRKEKK